MLGEKSTGQLAAQQFHTLREFYLKLPDTSSFIPGRRRLACGADIGARFSSTIGYERNFNKFLQFEDAKSFTDYAVSTAPPVPRYYPVMKKVNAEGRKCWGVCHALRVCRRRRSRTRSRRTRRPGRYANMLAFGGGHIAGALNIAGTPMLSIWAGAANPEKPVLLVLEEDDDLERIVRLFVRTGFTKFAGYLVGGMNNRGTQRDFRWKESARSRHELNARELLCRLSMCVRRVNGTTATFPAPTTFLSRELGNRAGRRSRQTYGGLLRHRLSRQHRHEHPEAARLRRGAQCSRKLARLERGEAAS